MLMDGFFSKKLYAAKTERTFITKLNTLRCLECTICATFLSSSLTCCALVVAYGNVCAVNETYTRVTTINVLRTIGITNFYKDFLIPNSGYYSKEATHSLSTVYRLFAFNVVMTPCAIMTWTGSLSISVDRYYSLLLIL